ncbi:endonuclease YncB(thermonuclease family) [Variovorax boronicumulans]|uniref:Endonuclease YncB(Thermonuclease family) n=1 Tax=Variovorax boronicumulans TaxID=436515 RepID=A0AAW8D1A3_9BURK|nr:thermonuclease family protein [Variovorax boronicumulans]MDP9897418.1 endonuclease YncB(thermonuclease family) [Variovorax boronicumulans]MDQ0057440.1 endonuclease YncB(thermonuclease family) [Variovorax boronicumulans]
MNEPLPAAPWARIRKIAAYAALMCAAAAAHADFSGTVVRILDGDTLDVLVDRAPVRVRLAEIDAPEKGQPFDTKARQALADLVFRREVRVTEAGQDRHGRRIGTIFVDGTSANRTMVASGMAWAYRAYLVDRSLIRVEEEARATKRGLWVDSDAQAPWQWRAEKRVASAQ